MIQLGNTLFGVGRATARTATVAFIVACTSYAALSVGLIGAIIITTRPMPPWLRTTLSLSGFGCVITFMIALTVAMILFNAQAQDNETGERPIVFSLGVIGRAVLHRAIWPILIFFIVGAGLSGAQAKPQDLHTITIGPRQMVFTVTLLFLMGWHIKHAFKLVRTMRSQAADKTGKYPEVFRGFDWSRITRSARSRFDEKYFSQTWKLPSDIQHPAEASKYATRARRFKHGWTAANAAIAVLVISSLNVNSLARAAWVTTPGSFGPLGAIFALAAIIVVPIMIQGHAKNLEDLAKDYAEREKTLLEETLPEDAQPLDLSPQATSFANPLPAPPPSVDT
ncbi:hypothetical protein [Mycobacteroides abscessus]